MQTTPPAIDQLIGQILALSWSDRLTLAYRLFPRLWWQPQPPTVPTKRRSAPPALAGKVTILGDIIRPIVSENEWECLK